MYNSVPASFSYVFYFVNLCCTVLYCVVFCVVLRCLRCLVVFDVFCCVAF